jgi:hypothetical protein
VGIEAKPEAEEAWRAKMADMRVDHDEFLAARTPGYLNLAGNGDHVYNYYYGAGPAAYRRELDVVCQAYLRGCLENRT